MWEALGARVKRFKLPEQPDPINPQDVATKAYVDSGGGAGKITWLSEESDTGIIEITKSGIPVYEEIDIFAWSEDDGVNNYIPSLRFNGDSGNNYSYTNIGTSSSGSPADNVYKLNRQGTASGSQSFNHVIGINGAKSEYDSRQAFLHETIRIGSQIAYNGGGSWNDASRITSVTLRNSLGLNVAAMRLLIKVTTL